MSLKSYISPKIQDYKKNGSGDILFGIQSLKPYVLLPIYEAYNSFNSNPITELKAIELDNTGKEINEVVLANNLIVFNAGQYLIDSSKIITPILNYGIYYLQFNNGFSGYKTDPFIIKKQDYLLTFDNSHVTFDSTEITFDNLTFNI